MRQRMSSRPCQVQNNKGIGATKESTKKPSEGFREQSTRRKRAPCWKFTWSLHANPNHDRSSSKASNSPRNTPPAPPQTPERAILGTEARARYHPGPARPALPVELVFADARERVAGNPVGVQRALKQVLVMVVDCLMINGNGNRPERVTEPNRPATSPTQSDVR